MHHGQSIYSFDEVPVERHQPSIPRLGHLHRKALCCSHICRISVKTNRNTKGTISGLDRNRQQAIPFGDSRPVAGVGSHVHRQLASPPGAQRTVHWIGTEEVAVALTRQRFPISRQSGSRLRSSRAIDLKRTGFGTRRRFAAGTTEKGSTLRRIPILIPVCGSRYHHAT